MEAGSSAGDGPSPSSSSSSTRQRCFVESCGDVSVSFQVVDLGRQLYVWLAVGGAQMTNMYLGIQTTTVRGQQHRSAPPGPAGSFSLSLSALSLSA